MSHTSAESVTKTSENEEQFFTLWTVFKRSADVQRSGDAAQEFEALVEKLAVDGVVLRGSYDVSAMRSDADIRVWLHGAKPEDLQAAVRSIRRSKLFAGTEIALVSLRESCSIVVSGRTDATRILLSAAAKITSWKARSA